MVGIEFWMVLLVFGVGAIISIFSGHEEDDDHVTSMEPEDRE